MSDKHTDGYSVHVEPDGDDHTWSVFHTERHTRGMIVVANGEASSDAVARKCAEAVVAALEGRRILCEGSLIPGALWPLGNAPHGAAQEQRDGARTELAALRERITAWANRVKADREMGPPDLLYYYEIRALLEPAE